MDGPNLNHSIGSIDLLCGVDRRDPNAFLWMQLRHAEARLQSVSGEFTICRRERDEAVRLADERGRALEEAHAKIAVLTERVADLTGKLQEQPKPRPAVPAFVKPNVPRKRRKKQAGRPDIRGRFGRCPRRSIRIRRFLCRSMPRASLRAPTARRN